MVSTCGELEDSFARQRRNPCRSALAPAVTSKGTRALLPTCTSGVHSPASGFACARALGRLVAQAACACTRAG